MFLLRCTACVLATCALSLAASTPFTFANLPGLESSATVMRRDPSDIIKVRDRYYVWYTKGTLFHGYDATIWFATSADGHAWTERGEALARGGPSTWDEQSVFSPNILEADGRFWLFFTAVPRPFADEGDRVTRSAIGIAVSDTPDGPWTKLPGNPALRCSADPHHFDSLRVDDACLLMRGGKYWLYYKGRQWNNTPANTRMGVAIAAQPGGPYIKFEGNPVIPAGHEVLVWPHGRDVIALINIGPPGFRRTLQRSSDGIHFSKLAELPGVPLAPGAYRPQAFTGGDQGKMIEWGICIGDRKGMLPFLQRFEWTGPAHP